MDGFFISKPGSCTAIISSQESRTLHHPSSMHHQAALRAIWAMAHKKAAGLALTRLATLRHNNLVRECVHNERVFAQPMTSGGRTEEISFCNALLRDH